MNLIYICYCKKCGGAYDIGTNYDICPACRGLIKKGVENGEEERSI